MKIKILTCHDVYNYGASLQAFALQTYIEKVGHNVRIIDYKPNYIDFPYKLSLFVHPASHVKYYTDKSIFFKYLYALKRFLWYIPLLSRKKAFDKFTHHFLKLTDKYTNYKELVNCTHDADTYIVGSDQVWNSITMLNGKDPAFYLQFVPNTKKRISYAASFGATSVSEEYKRNIQLWLSTFDCISVRENSGVEILRELGIKGVQVCDPVFLLSKEEWRMTFKIVETTQPYVLIYNLTSINTRLVEDAKKTADYLGAKLISVSPMKIKQADKCLQDAAPDRFVSLIFNATYVFTNSFHATAFSIIAHRQFCTYNYHSESNSSRLYSVLDEMDLLDRLNVKNIDEVLVSPIDYSSKEHLIAESYKRGQDWLMNNL